MGGGIALLTMLRDELIASYGDAACSAELTLARDQYAARRGRVFEDEEHWESVTRGFLEWYVVEREYADTGRAPARIAAREESDETRAEGLSALASSQRSLIEITGLGKGVVHVRDLFGGALFAVAEERSLVGMNKGDVAEVRLIGFQEQVWLGRLYLDHPADTLELIADRLTRMREQGHPRADALDHLAILRSRSRSYRHVSAIRIYESNGDIAGAS